jgi:hypothetical protein
MGYPTKYAYNATNFAVHQYCVLCNGNGSYTGAPARILYEDANNPMENILRWDRRAVCRVPDGQTGNNGINLDFDIALGASRPVKALGLMGMLKNPSSAYPMQWQAYYIANPTYNPANFVQFFTQSQSWTAERDIIKELTATVNNVRYVRFRFLNITLADWFEIGKFFVGALIEPTPTGIMYTPGSSRNPLLARSRVETVDGAPWTAELGPTRHVFHYVFTRANECLKEDMVVLSQELKPFLLQYAGTGAFYECVMVPDGFSCQHIWGYSNDPSLNTDIWDIEIEMESLY